MKLRGQILLGVLLSTAVPLILVMGVTRQVVSRRFTDLDTRRVEDQMRLTRQDLSNRDSGLERMLASLGTTMEADNRFRLAVSGQRPDLKPYLVDFAPRHMSLMNLDFLQLQDESGTIISSGHFRTSFGRVDPHLPRILAQVPGGRALITARSAEGPFLALARLHSITLGGKSFQIIGGLRLDPSHLRTLSRDDDLDVVLAWGEGVLSTSPGLTRELKTTRRPEEIPFLLRRRQALVRTSEWPLIDQGRPSSALLVVTHNRHSLHRALRDLNLKLGGILLLALIAAVLLAVWLANRLSRPLRRLSAQTQDLDFDNLEARFESRRRDEVGQLTRLLGEMTARLRTGVNRLRDAEHRATLGEVARQVNHDVRNGITPLRNVLRHLSQVAQEDPQNLGTIFQERQGTLENGLSYLEDLAAHYARLSPERGTRLVALDEIVTQIMTGPSWGDEVKLENKLPVNLPPVQADPVSLRRIFDNLVRNAVQSLPDGRGTVAVNAFLEEDPDLEEMRIKVEISDTGSGIEPENLELVFNDFFTTREEGTGLGLSNVRRLAADCGARVSVQSERGHGSVFTLSFPLPDMGAR